MIQRRLPPAPATDEDALIWWEVSFARFGQGNPYIGKWLVNSDSDRRDAELMYALRDARAACDRNGVLHCLLAWEGIAVYGFDDFNRSLTEQGLAVMLPKLPERYR